MASKRVKKDATVIVSDKVMTLEEQEQFAKLASSVDEIKTSYTYEYIAENKVKLGISIGMVINAPEGTKLIEVSNLGAGDMYVDDKSFNYSQDKLVSVGMTASIPNTTSVYLISNSRPTALIKFYK
jgi:tRNA-binding EMAP/Myf-like protein